MRFRELVSSHLSIFFFFFFNDTATTEIYTLSLHDALPIYPPGPGLPGRRRRGGGRRPPDSRRSRTPPPGGPARGSSLPRRRRHSGSCGRDRKSTRLNSSHSQISYAVFCLKKKKKIEYIIRSICAATR